MPPADEFIRVFGPWPPEFRLTDATSKAGEGAGCPNMTAAANTAKSRYRRADTIVTPVNHQTRKKPQRAGYFHATLGLEAILGRSSNRGQSESKLSLRSL